MQAVESLGFVGLGNIGAPMCTTLVRAGFRVIAFDLRDEASERVVGDGAQAVQSLGSLAAQSRIVHVAVVDDAQLEAVVAGTTDGPGLGELLAPDSVIVVHSTVRPSTVRDLADQYQASGVRFVDAPVSGGESGARSGSLKLWVGGEDDDVRRVQPPLDALGSMVVRTGDLGTGLWAKIVNNHMAACNLAVAREAAELAARGGIDVARMVELAAGGTGDSHMLRHFEEYLSLALERYTTGSEGFGRLMRKDLQLAVQQAADAGLGLPIAGLVSELSYEVFRPVSRPEHGRQPDQTHAERTRNLPPL